MNQAALPQPIADYMARSAASLRQPAWLYVRSDGRLLDTGGDLAAYGLRGLAPDVDVRATVPFLDGLLPVGAEGVHLPWLTMEDGRFADVHILPGEAADWVLLLDATADAERASPFQQRRNEASLQLERSLFRALRGFFGGAGCLGLKQLSGGSYRVVGSAPGWAAADLELEPGLRPASIFPFLRSFLPEAEAFFEERAAGILGSDPWTQTMRGFGELQLEAFAVLLDPPCRAVFIAPIGRHARDRERMLQSAREQQLQHEHLGRTIERKDVIVHCIVHDLKGPLSCMQGYIQLALTEGSDPVQQRHFMEQALAQCGRQGDLIAEVLDVVAAEHLETLQDEVERIAPAAWVRGSAGQFAGGYAQAGLHLHVEVSPEAEAVWVVGHARRADRVLANLLENALRHTPTGGDVHVRVACDDEVVVIRVENDGAEVPAEQRPTLFNRFTTSAKGGGSMGLGLFFCRITVERWGGQIDYRQRPQGGSCFEICLPAAKPTA